MNQKDRKIISVCLQSCDKCVKIKVKCAPKTEKVIIVCLQSRDKCAKLK